jgi:hypothetical protein
MTEAEYSWTPNPASGINARAAITVYQQAGQFCETSPHGNQEHAQEHCEGQIVKTGF